MVEIFLPPFEQPGTFLRFFDNVEMEWKFIQLTEMEGPLRYPWRFDETSHGELSDEHTFDDIEPSRTENHLSQVFLGVKPDARYLVWQPVDQRALQWDETVEDIQDELTDVLEFPDSPFHAPRFNLWIREDQPPSVQARAFPGPGEKMTPEIIWVGAKYNFITQADLSDEVVDKLRNREIDSTPIKFQATLP